MTTMVTMPCLSKLKSIQKIKLTRSIIASRWNYFRMQCKIQRILIYGMKPSNIISEFWYQYHPLIKGSSSSTIKSVEAPIEETSLEKRKNQIEWMNGSGTSRNKRWWHLVSSVTIFFVFLLVTHLLHFTFCNSFLKIIRRLSLLFRV
jgi:hypothetical protein